VTLRPEDTGHMAHALRLAARGLGNTWPNPAVGCVIVKDGVIVGRGWTQAGGRPHAEVRALQQAGGLRLASRWSLAPTTAILRPAPKH
jgi:diaminohydroxyphosphoribosylaminopyrimidine deaminase / 5-amino-6-(5-phosphoribosylamino)uracil reductase